MPSRKVSSTTEVGQGKAPAVKKARRAAAKSEPGQSRLPVVWRPVAESQLRASGEEPPKGFAPAPTSVAVAAHPSEVLAVVAFGTLPPPAALGSPP